MKLEINNIHKIRKSFQKKIEMHAHFERPCNKLNNVKSNVENTKTKTGKSENIQKPPNFTSEFQFYISFSILILVFHLGFTLQTYVYVLMFCTIIVS